MNNKYIKKLWEVLFLIFIAIFFLNLTDFYAYERFLSIGGNTRGNFGIAEYIRQFVFILEYILAIFLLYALTNLKKKYGLPILILIWALLLIDTTIYNIIGVPADILYIHRQDHF